MRKGERMKRKVLIFTMLLATAFVALPVESFASADKTRDKNSVYEYSGQDWRRSGGRRGRGRSRGWKNTYGYRNYGQYRRTQVGNRRYRMVRRYYWNDGVRRFRWSRLYY